MTRLVRTTLLVFIGLLALACTPGAVTPDGSVDTDPPVLALPATTTVMTADPQGQVVDFDVAAVDMTDGPLPVDCTPPSGSWFAVGPTDVECTAVDRTGNRASGSFEVVVALDTSRASPLATTSGHVCAVVTGTVSCWGEQLTRVTPLQSFLPVRMPSLTGITDVAVGGSHACVIGTGGTVQCWGYNFHGALGNGSSADSATPVPVSGVVAATTVATGDGHSCAAVADGSVRCWGKNFSGQLGVGSTVDAHVPVVVPGITDAVAVGAGGSATCAVHATGAVSCWGSGGTYQLGATNPSRVLSPVVIAGISDAVDVAVGSGGQTCALTRRGTASCWGSNVSGKLGDGTTTSRSTPMDVPGRSDVVAIAAGRDQTCAIDAGGGAWCWGGNLRGQLGDRTDLTSTVPVAVAGVAGATAIATGTMNSCAAHADGGISCWGDNESGQVGIGETGEEDRPVSVPGVDDVRSVATGQDRTCVVVGSGQARCWGVNNWGQLGRGSRTNTPENLRPADVVGLADAQHVASGTWHSCALRASGEVVCWGYDASGQLGNGVIGNGEVAAAPVSVLGIVDAVSVDAGGSTSCAVRSTGSVSCWGSGTSGQLGDGRSRTSATPVDVVGLGDAVQVAVAGDFTCALTSTGSVWCWGNNSQGSLGDGTVTRRSVPVAVTGLAGATQLVASGGHACALSAEGTARCWGDNFKEQLGNDNGTIDSTVPVDVVGLSGAVALSAGAGYTCAVLETGALSCWGTDFMGQIVHGQVDVHSGIPVEVPGVAGAVQMDSDWAHRCVVTRTGGLQCWGGNWEGQLGLGTASAILQPTRVVGLG